MSNIPQIKELLVQAINCLNGASKLLGENKKSVSDRDIAEIGETLVELDTYFNVFGKGTGFEKVFFEMREPDEDSEEFDYDEDGEAGDEESPFVFHVSTSLAKFIAESDRRGLVTRLYQQNKGYFVSQQALALYFAAAEQDGQSFFCVFTADEDCDKKILAKIRKKLRTLLPLSLVSSRELDEIRDDDGTGEWE